MKSRLLGAVVVLAIPLVGSSADAEDWTPLFNGKDLSGLKVQFKDADKDADPKKTFSVKEGVLVKSVAADSVGAKAGLKAGDVITGVNGRKVYDSSDVTRALERSEDGAEVTIEITRDKKTQTLKGRLEARDTKALTRIRTIV